MSALVKPVLVCCVVICLSIMLHRVSSVPNPGSFSWKLMHHSCSGELLHQFFSTFCFWAYGTDRWARAVVQPIRMNWMPWFLRSGEVSGKNQKKSGNFTFRSQGKMRVRESRGKSKYQGAKVNKDAEEISNCFTQTAYNSSQIFFRSLCLQIICIFTFKSVPPPLFPVRLQAIESQRWYFPWTN